MRDRTYWAKLLPVIEAFCRGEECEYLVVIGGGGAVWVRIDPNLSVGWHEDTEYRIKPKTIKTRRYWWKNTQNTFAPYVALSTRDECHKIESLVGFGGWIDDDWVELELPTTTKTDS